MEMSGLKQNSNEQNRSPQTILKLSHTALVFKRGVVYTVQRKRKSSNFCQNSSKRKTIDEEYEV